MTLAEAAGQFADLDVPGWAWLALVSLIVAVLVFDILVVHRRAHIVHAHEALIASATWISIGFAFAGVVALVFGGRAAGEYVGGYLIEMSLSLDNIFVWALILSHFKIPSKYQHRVLFWGIFGALALRAGFILAGVALIETFTWVLYVFGAFLVFTAIRLVVTEHDEIDPSSSRIMRLINRVLPMTTHLDDHKMFTRLDGRLVATPLFGVLILIEITDVLFAVDSVPAVLAVTREQFIVFSSNAFAIIGLRSLYFLLADARNRFEHLQKGIAVVLAFVGAKMLVHEWYQIPTWLSLAVICFVLLVAVGVSSKANDDGASGRQEGERNHPLADPPLDER